MRDELRDALDHLVAALEAHAEAAAAVTRPDVPDPLPQATAELTAAVAQYVATVDATTGAHVPWDVPEPPIGGPDDDDEPTRFDVVGRWTYEVPSLARLVGQASDRAGERPEVALYELLRRRGHPLRWAAPDLVVHDRSVVGIFPAGDGSYVDEPVGDALRPPTGEALYAWADLPPARAQAEDDGAPHIDDLDWAGDAERWR